MSVDDGLSISPHPANRGAIIGTKMSAIMASCAGGAIYGVAAGIIGGISDAMVKDRFFPNSTSSRQSIMSGILTASLLLGAFAGCFLGVDAGNRWGHRIGFRITGAVCTIMSITLALMPTFELIVIARMLLGVSVGFTSALAPWYVNDAIPAATRGSIGTIFQINICAFILVGEICNYAFHPNQDKNNIHVDEWKWKLQLGLSAIPGLCILVISFIMHESPVFLAGLIERERRGVVGSNEDSEDAALKAVVADEKGANVNNAAAVVAGGSGEATIVKQGWSDLLSAKNWNWVFISFILSFSNQLTGINAVIFYAPAIFKDAGFSNPLVLTIAVVGTWNLLSVFISFGLVDRFGRRPLMLSALFLMGCGAGIMALAYEFFPGAKATLAILALLMFVGAFECGPGPLFFLMAVETFPPELRDPALSLTQSSAWVFSIVITFGFPVLNDALGSAATFLIFFITCALSLVLIWWKVPEPMAAAVGVGEKADKDIVRSGRAHSIGDAATTTAYQKL